MLIEMRTQGLDLAGVVHRHLERQVRASLRWSGTDVRAVTLWLSDVNGPRGGADLHCAVSLDLTPRGSVRAEATDSDLFAAVTRALARARRSVDRDAGRDRSLKRGDSKPAVRVGRFGRAEPVPSDRRASE